MSNSYYKQYTSFAVKILQPSMINWKIKNGVEECKLEAMNWVGEIIHKQKNPSGASCERTEHRFKTFYMCMRTV